MILSTEMLRPQIRSVLFHQSDDLVQLLLCEPQGAHVKITNWTSSAPLDDAESNGGINVEQPDLELRE